MCQSSVFRYFNFFYIKFNWFLKDTEVDMTPTAMVTTDMEATEDTITPAMEAMVDMVSRMIGTVR